jgi:hypothetical protein
MLYFKCMNTPFWDRAKTAVFTALAMTVMTGLIAFACAGTAGGNGPAILEDDCSLCSTRQTLDHSLPRHPAPGRRNAPLVPALPVPARVTAIMTALPRLLPSIPDPVTSILLPSVVLLV